jgi:hypothetical protein
MNLGRQFGADVPLAKGEDDGAIFLGWLKERISPGFGKKVDLQVIKTLFEKYGFMVFAPKVCYISFSIKSGNFSEIIPRVGSCCRAASFSIRS